MKTNDKLRIAERIYSFAEKLKKLSEEKTPKIQYCEVEAIESPFHWENVHLLPERRNFKLIEKEYFIDTGKYLEKMDQRLTRDILWAFNHRKSIPSGIEESGKIDRHNSGWDYGFNYAKSYDAAECPGTVPSFERPYENTVVVSHIQSSSNEKSHFIVKYILSSSELELLQAYCKGLEGKLFLIKDGEKDGN